MNIQKNIKKEKQLYNGRQKSNKKHQNQMVFGIKVPRDVVIVKWDWIVVNGQTMRVKNKPYKKLVKNPSADYVYYHCGCDGSSFDPRPIGTRKAPCWVDGLEAEIWTTK